MPHQCTNCGRTFPDGSREMLSGCPDCGGNKFQFQPSSADGQRDDAAEGQGQVGESPNTAEPTAGGASGSTGSIAGAVSDATDRVRDWVDGDDREWPDESDAPNEDAAQADARTGVVSPNELPDPPADARLDTTPDTSSDEVIDASPDAPPEAPEAVDGSDGTPIDRSSTDAASPDTLDTPAPNASEASDRSETTAEDERPDSDDDDSDLAPGSDPDLAELRAELNEQFESIKIVSPGQYELNLMELYDRDEYIISLMEDGRYAIEVPEAWRDDG